MFINVQVNDWFSAIQMPRWQFEWKKQQQCYGIEYTFWWKNKNVQCFPSARSRQILAHAHTSASTYTHTYTRTQRTAKPKRKESKKKVVHWNSFTIKCYRLSTYARARASNIYTYYPVLYLYIIPTLTIIIIDFSLASVHWPNDNSTQYRHSECICIIFNAAKTIINMYEATVYLRDKMCMCTGIQEKIHRFFHFSFFFCRCSATSPISLCITIIMTIMMSLIHSLYTCMQIRQYTFLYEGKSI